MILKDLGIPGRVKALVIPTNEELMIAKKAFNLI
jgi:acetate kinase